MEQIKTSDPNGESDDPSLAFPDANDANILKPLVSSGITRMGNDVPCSYVAPRKALLVGEALMQNTRLLAGLTKMKIEYLCYEDTNFNVKSTESTAIIFVFEDFCGPLFQSLKKKSRNYKIYGAPAIIETATLSPASNSELASLPVSVSGYPIYSSMLRNCRVSVTGITNREELCDVRRKILYLGGIFNERDDPPTYLIAAKCAGNKYRNAVALDKPILKPDWIDFLWQSRNDENFDFKKAIPSYRVLAFYGLRIALEGYDDAEKDKMVKLIMDNEGEYVEIDDSSASHIVKGGQPSVSKTFEVPNSSSPAVKNDILATKDDETSPMKRARYELKDYSGNHAKVLKDEWFWSSIQIEACANEEDYLLTNPIHEEKLDNSLDAHVSFYSPPSIAYRRTVDNPSLSDEVSSASRRNRKRFRRLLSPSSQGHDAEWRCFMEVDEDKENDELQKRVFDTSDDEVSDAQLDYLYIQIEKTLNSKDLKPKMAASKRLQEFLHLVETERNYVSILQTILKLFKEPCEQQDQKAGRILSALEIKTIFGPIIPIYSVHKRLLRDMVKVLETWTEESITGQIYVEYAEDLRRCYEPFVGYFETIKNEIARCELENSRFFAFLRIAQRKPQCGREKLAELVIRPVQRLPSTALILKSLEKNTSFSNPDFEWIRRGVAAIDRVNRHVNQNKEKADVRVAMFNVFNEIESCPPETISDHRTLLKKYDVTSMNDILVAKNEDLSLIVFSDHFQVVKRRNLTSVGKRMSLGRNPRLSRKSFTLSSGGATQQKKYKFVAWIDFCHVKKIVDITDFEPKSLGFIVREPDETAERLLMFTVPEDSELEKFHKVTVVEFFAKQVAQTITKPEYQNLIMTLEAKTLLGHKNHRRQSLSVKETAVRLKNKVGRALTLNQTHDVTKQVYQIMESTFDSSNPYPHDSDATSHSSVSSSEYTMTATPTRYKSPAISNWFGTKKTYPVSSTPKSRQRKSIRECTWPSEK